MNQITVYNLDQHPTKPFDTFVELQGDLKQYTETRKLADRIASVGFKYDFLAWEAPEPVEHHGTDYPAGTLFIVDAHSRQRALSLLQQDGWKISPVPFTRVHAASLEEAKAELLFLNSQYGVLDFDSEEYEDILSLLDDVDISTLSLPETNVDAVLQDVRPTIDFLQDDDEDADDDGEQQYTGDGARIPLAIVLSAAEYEHWQSMKAQLGIATDTKAFLAMLQQMR